VPGAEGYKYFGAAKNLPKVRELFSSEAQVRTTISSKDLYQRVDEYYLGLSLDGEE